MLTSVNSENLNTLICKSYLTYTSATFYLEEILVLESALKHFLHA